jgi:50S ribosomal subunit-associated GTPase HflX
VVLNKADAADPVALRDLATRYDEAPAVSAISGLGLDDLKKELARWVGVATPAAANADQRSATSI